MVSNHARIERIENRKTRRSAGKRTSRPKFRAVFEKIRSVREIGGRLVMGIRVQIEACPSSDGEYAATFSPGEKDLDRGHDSLLQR